MFKVSSGSWETCVKANNFHEAVTIAAKLMYEEYGTEMDVSYIFTVENMITTQIEIFPTDAVLQDLGLYELAYNLKCILES